MATDERITEITALTTPAMEDLLPIVDSPSLSPTTKKMTLENLASPNPGANAFLLRTNANGQLQLSGSLGVGSSPGTDSVLIIGEIGVDTAYGVRTNALVSKTASDMAGIFSSWYWDGSGTPAGNLFGIRGRVGGYGGSGTIGETHAVRGEYRGIGSDTTTHSLVTLFNGRIYTPPAGTTITKGVGLLLPDVSTFGAGTAYAIETEGGDWYLNNGGLGIGRTPTAAGVDVTRTASDDATNAARFRQEVTKTSGVARGVQGYVRWEGSSNQTSDGIVGFEAFLTTTGSASPYDLSCFTAYPFIPNGYGQIPTLYGLRVINGVAAASNVAVGYGLHIEDCSDLASTAYAIYSAGGDWLAIGANYNMLTLDHSNDAAIITSNAAAKVAFHGATPVAQQDITGSRGGNAALANLLTALATLGLITDSTT